MNSEEAYYDFSIVIPTLNQGSFLRECLDSILSQVGDVSVQVIIQDGGSTDSTQVIWESFLQELLKLGACREGDNKAVLGPSDRSRGRRSSWEFWSEKDSGQSQAINRGFARAIGRLLNWLSSDDLLLPGSLRTVLEASRIHRGAGVYFGSVRYENLISGHSVIYRAADPNVVGFLDEGQSLHQTAAFFERWVWDRWGGVREDLHFCMDTELYLRWFFQGVGFLRIESVLSVQRVHGNSKTGSDDVLFRKFGKESESVRQHYRSHLSPRYRWDWVVERWRRKLGKIAHAIRKFVSMRLLGRKNRH